MNSKLIREILIAPDEFSEIQRFCEGLDEYSAVKAKLTAWYEKLEKVLGYEAVNELEDTVLRCGCLENQAYYAFGLHVRDELRRALML